MKKPTFISLFLVAVIFFGFVFSLESNAQTSIKKIETKAELKSKDKSPALNIKATNHSLNNKHKQVQPSGLGKKEKKTNLDVTIYNKTDYIVDIYINDEFAGTMNGGSAATVKHFDSVTSLYAAAFFDDGSFLEWGPTAVDHSKYASYEWTLIEE